jgi:serine/threonine protein kinase
MRIPLSVESVLVDRYSVLKLLHQGAGGWVYLAIDQTTNRFCVLEETQDFNEFQMLLSDLKLRGVAQYERSIAQFGQVYLVRNYTEGHSYRALLQQQRIFSELEVMRFLKQVLLLLRSLQQLKIEHRNISLNSIIQRSDRSLLLTEFTRASSSETFDSDLYQLAVIAIVLLTGCEPKDLYNEATQQWEWHDWEPVNSRLVKVLDRMLSHEFATANQVLRSLFAPDQKDVASIVFTFVLIGLATISAYRLIHHLSNLQPAIVPASVSVDAASAEPIAQRAKRLQVSQPFLARLSQETSQTTESLLKRLEGLSQEARRGLGTYKRVNYTAWLSKRSSDLSDRAIETLSDAQFVAFFPDQKGRILNPKTFGQVWYAIAFDRIKIAKSDLITSNLSGTLRHGVGRVYRSQFRQGQMIRLNLKTDQIAVWMFSGDTTLIKNSSQPTWTGQIPRSGIYELIITPTRLSDVQYELNIQQAQSDKEQK